MPFRVGIDLVDVEEVQESVRAHGERYLHRVYSDEELRECGGDARPLASRFAAKEATMKALARGDEGISWRSIEVRHDAGGCPSLMLTGAAADLFDRRRVTGLSVSLTQRGALIGAVVLAELSP